MTGIFISYRQNHYPGDQPVRRAHAQLVEAIAERLVQHFGPDKVFLDTELRLAVRYPQELRERLERGELIIAVIHENWLEDLTDRQGRIGPLETDWVRYELATALAAGKAVLPVLIDSARLPGAAELPPDIAELGRCQAHRIQFGHWKRDLTRLIQEAEHHVSTEPPPQAEQEYELRPRPWFWLAAAGVLGLVAPYLGVRAFHPDLPNQQTWLTALAIVLLLILFVGLAMVGVPYAARNWFDSLDREAAMMSRDLRTNVIIGLTIAGLGTIVLLTSSLFTPMEHVLLLACLVGLVVVMGTRWLRERRGAEIWPAPKIGADPASIRGAIARVDQHLTDSAPLMTRFQRDKARFAIDQIDRNLARLRAEWQADRRRWLRMVTPWLTGVYTCLFGATAGATAAALLLYWIGGGHHWQAPLWATGCLLIAVGFSLATIELGYWLHRFRRQVVLDAAPADLEKLELRFTGLSIAPSAAVPEHHGRAERPPRSAPPGSPRPAVSHSTVDSD